MSEANDRDAGRPAGSRPFAELRARLATPRNISQELAPEQSESGRHGGQLRLDPGRWRRIGIPEVVLASGKAPATVIDALVSLARANGRAVASRCAPEHVDEIAKGMPAGFRVEVHPDADAIVAISERHDRAELIPTGGRVGIIAAGASDARTAAEAALVATEMGCRVRRVDDVGVAGLHRLIEPLEALLVEGTDAIIVAAGMDGALPSVVAGLVDVPVIGLPTAIGYGMGGGGEAALLAMLQSCAPGLVVVNIDNGIGAGAAAARIANRAAAARDSAAHSDPTRDGRDYPSTSANSSATTSAGERVRSTT